MTRAVVFAYHNVGVRCLSVLLAQGVKVALVVTHTDNPSETIWFESVEKLARQHGIPVITPADPNVPEVIAQVQAAAPDFIFSFYYRNMLKAEILAIPKRGALNMHGSLLPKYRGRVPVNWAVIHGETETGATLHYMLEKPDAGDIVAQQAVPILPDDTSGVVFQKVTLAAEAVLQHALPLLIAGTAPRLAQDLSQGGYFGGRKPEDGKINWQLPAQAIHNLVRGVAPPYPGAFTLLAGKSMRVLKTLLAPTQNPRATTPALYVENGNCYAICGEGVLQLLEFEIAAEAMNAEKFAARFGSAPVIFEDTQ